jgi:hypothetical protein
MKYSVQVMPRAMIDVNCCLQFIEQHSKQGAATWLKSFELCRDGLAVSPLSHSLAPESEFVDYEIREVRFQTRRGRPYRMLFTVVGDRVKVVHIRGPGQDFVSADNL